MTPVATAIPAGCDCTWLLATTDPATWRLEQTGPRCKVHADSSDEKSGGTA